MKKYAQNKSMVKPRRRFLAPFVIITILIVAGVLTFFFRPESKMATPQPSVEIDTINFDPPSEEVRQETEENKKTLGDKPSGDTTNPTPANVTPIVVDAGQYDQLVEVRAFVPGIYEDGGTCTATLTKQNLKLVKQSGAFKDATTTQCHPIIINRSEFSEAGMWTLVLSYAHSSGSNGSSAPRDVEVR
jgi:hypothetical protein